jgi:hypothetical protein
MRALVLTSLMIVLAACPSSSGSGGQGGGNGGAGGSGAGTGGGTGTGTGGGSGSVTPATGFQTTAGQWSVPASGTSAGFDERGSAGITANNVPAFWSTFDIDGDGKPDLVQTADTGSSTVMVWGNASSPYWKVFKNTGSAFSMAAQQWPVPASGTSAGFDVTAEGGITANNVPAFWSTFDIDGDGKPDLVQTADTGSTTVQVWGNASSPYWKVFKNTGSGFSTAAQQWPVPASGTSAGFDVLAEGGITANNVPAFWSTFDIDGDGKPDLVQTADTGSTTVRVWGNSSAPYWKVFKNTGSGFSTTAQQWPVPASGTSAGFDVIAEGGITANNVPAFWSTFDIDGDGKPDLVQTADTGKSSPMVWGNGAAPFWNVFRNTGTGFSTTAQQWPVPASGTSAGFDVTAEGGITANNVPAFWSTFDIDGDRKPDLVQTADTASTTVMVWGNAGSPYWNVFKNSGTGFSTTAQQWPVPASGTSAGFDVVAEGGITANNVPAFWTTFDIDGDGKPDLVQTADTGSTTVRVWGNSAAPFWKVYRATP